MLEHPVAAPPATLPLPPTHLLGVPVTSEKVHCMVRLLLVRPCSGRGQGEWWGCGAGWARVACGVRSR